MVILHPVFIVVFLVMILYSFAEINGNRRYSKLVMMVLGVVLTLLSGLRKNVGADYPQYKEMYSLYFPTMVDYGELFDKALFRESVVEIEWLYALTNKLVFDFTGVEFHIFTLILATFLIGVKFATIYKNSEAPVFALLFYFIPTFFIADCGHVRQGMGMTVLLFAFKYIKERKVWMYLLCVYIAFGFHKSSIIFLPAYWFATVELNSKKILYLVAACVILSPFQVYNSFSFFLDTIAVQEVTAGYEGYITYEIEESGVIKFMDVLTLFFAGMMIKFDEDACAKIPYYEYMRNIGVLGICIYFIMRENPVFSTRLVGVYLMYMTVIMSNIFYSINNIRTKRTLHILYVAFIIFYFFVFSSYQARGGRFTIDTYNNYLW